MVRVITTRLSELEYRLIRGVHWDFLCFAKVVSLPLIGSSSLPFLCLELCFRIRDFTIFKVLSLILQLPDSFLFLFDLII